MKAKKNPKTQQHKIDDTVQKELQILYEAIQPRRMNKDLKTQIVNVGTKKIYEILLIDQNNRSPINAGQGTKLTLLPIFLYLIFTHKRLTVKISWSKKQFIVANTQKLQKNLSSSNNFIQQSQEFVEYLLKEKKFKKLLDLIDQKMKIYQQQVSRKILGQKDFKQKVQIQCLQFNIMDESVTQLQNTLGLIQMFYSILGNLFKRYEIVIKKMTVKIQSKIENSSRESYQKLLQRFSWYFWNLIFQVKSVNSIQIKLPSLRSFLNPISLVLKNLQKTQQNISISQKKEEDSQNLRKQLLFSQIFRIEMLETIKEEGSVTSLNQLIPLIRVLPNLKFLMFNVQDFRQSDTPILMKDSYKIFKTISQKNRLLETLCLLGFQLQYEQKNIENSQKKLIKSELDILQNSLSQSDKIDQNLFWMQKMQESCPYLSGVRLQFNRKTQTQERRLSQSQRKQYNQLIKKYTEIMNVFFHRGMNNQTFLNTIKILTSQGFDYETILGVLDKINPFAPL